MGNRDCCNSSREEEPSTANTLTEPANEQITHPEQPKQASKDKKVPLKVETRLRTRSTRTESGPDAHESQHPIAERPRVRKHVLLCQHLEPTCAACGKTNPEEHPPLRCDHCKAVCYCSLAHQKDDWLNAHQFECRTLGVGVTLAEHLGSLERQAMIDKWVNWNFQDRYAMLAALRFEHMAQLYQAMPDQQKKEIMQTLVTEHAMLLIDALHADDRPQAHGTTQSQLPKEIEMLSAEQQLEFKKMNEEGHLNKDKGKQGEEPCKCSIM